MSDLIFDPEPIEKRTIDGIYFKAVDVNTPVLFFISRKALEDMTRITSYANRSRLSSIFIENLNYIHRITRHNYPDLVLIGQYEYLQETKQDAYLVSANLF